jgi:PmbA protein
VGQKVASDKLTVIDDGTIPGLFGSSPFDDEGVPTRRTVVIDRGILRSYLLNTYTARKLGLRTTGNAARGITGNASVGHGNLYLEKGGKSPEEIVRGIGKGLYVTELIGSAVNTVTGDYSRGAAGLWIENGEFAYPVSEITIASNLSQMLMDIEAAGSDLEFRSSVASPTLLIREMTVSGQ